MSESAKGEVRRVALPDGTVAPVRLIVNPRARRISLRVDPIAREAVAVAPSVRSAPKAMRFAQDKAAWIVSALAALPRPVPFAPGAEVPVRGVIHRLDWRPGRAAPHIEPGDPPSLVAGGADVSAFAARVRRYLMGEARQALTESAERHAAALGVRLARLSVKDTRSRWGSCTSDGALAFSWRVILAPPAVLDYLAAHEVAHLLEMNHGPRFWALVARLCPEFQKARRWLERHGVGLHGYGVEGGV